MMVAPDAASLVADRLAALLGAALGRSRKVLVLDLDNTLWGGVIGDDGVEGIALGQGSGVQIGSALAGSQSWGIPAGFDTQGFITAAKGNFVTLQDAWDKSDIPTLRSMMTDRRLADPAGPSETGKADTDSLEIDGRKVMIPAASPIRWVDMT